MSTDSPAYAQHQAALEASPTTQSAVAELLLRRVLPRLAHAEGQGMDWRSCAAKDLLDILAPVLGAASLQPALQHNMLRLGGADIVQQAARVAAAVPLELPEGLPAQHFAAAHLNSAKQLSDLCTLLTSAAGEPGEPAGQAAAVSTAAGRAELQAAGWEVIGLVPHMKAVIQALWAGSSSELQQVLPATCLSFASALYHQDAWRTSIGSQQQLEAWVAAADAGMQLLPLLHQLDASWRRQQHLEPAMQSAALTTARLLLRMLHVGSFGAWEWAIVYGSALAVDVRASLAAQVAQVHSRSCRLLHWLAAGGHRALLPDQGSADDWEVLQELMCRQLDAADHLAPQAEDSSQHRHARWAHNGRTLHICR